jgi:hypothetical protein
LKFFAFSTSRFVGIAFVLVGWVGNITSRAL